jgi:predicted nucleic acid-binding protein
LLLKERGIPDLNLIKQAEQGPPIGPYDLLIAAQALRNRTTLVTAKVFEFARVRGLCLAGLDDR